MKTDIFFKTATKKDAEKLTTVSIKSFHTDVYMAGRDSIGGPPGYNSVSFHEHVIVEASQCFKILCGDRIIGGFWFFQHNLEEATLERIFIDPEFHSKGIGLKSFKFLFHSFPGVRSWTLKTPIWNTRTPEFYSKLGFEIVQQSEQFLIFKKEIGSNLSR